MPGKAITEFIKSCMPGDTLVMRVECRKCGATTAVFLDDPMILPRCGKCRSLLLDILEFRRKGEYQSEPLPKPPLFEPVFVKWEGKVIPVPTRYGRFTPFYKVVLHDMDFPGTKQGDWCD